MTSFKQRTSKVPPKSRYFWLEMVLMGEVYTARVQCRVCTRQAPSGIANVARPGRPGLIYTRQQQCVIQPLMQQVETARGIAGPRIAVLEDLVGAALTASAKAYSATTVLPADVCAATNTDSPCRGTPGCQHTREGGSRP